MRFWDASAIVPLIVRQEQSDLMQRLAEEDTAIATWWGSEVECASALARTQREQHEDGAEQFDSLAAVAAGWREIHPTREVKTIAVRLLRVHTLRAGDALQLAAAIVAGQRQPERLEFVCLDGRLRAAAAKEGFRVLPSPEA